MSVRPFTAEPLWDAEDVATYLKVSRSWVSLHGDRGDLPEERIGGLRRYPPEEVRNYALGKTPRAATGRRGHSMPS